MKLSICYGFLLDFSPSCRRSGFLIRQLVLSFLLLRTKVCIFFFSFFFHLYPSPFPAPPLVHEDHVAESSGDNSLIACCVSARFFFFFSILEQPKFEITLDMWSAVARPSLRGSLGSLRRQWNGLGREKDAPFSSLMLFPPVTYFGSCTAPACSPSLRAMK